MDQRELDTWAEKHRELARKARSGRRAVVIAAIALALALLFLFASLTGDSGSGGGIGPSLF